MRPMRAVRATLGAERLDSNLSAYFGEHGRLDGFARHFQRSLEEVLKVPWQMALMEDRLWVSVFSGAEPTLAERLMIKSSARVLNAVFADVETNMQFTRVAHMLDTPRSLLSLRTLAAIARGAGATRCLRTPRMSARRDRVERDGIRGVAQDRCAMAPCGPSEMGVTFGLIMVCTLVRP